MKRQILILWIIFGVLVGAEVVILTLLSWRQPEEMSAVGQVFGGIGTVGTLIYGLLLFGRQRKQLEYAEEDRKRSDAGKVAAWIHEDEDGGVYMYRVSVLNAGLSPAYACSVDVGLLGGLPRGVDHLVPEDAIHIWVFPVVPPGEKVHVLLGMDAPIPNGLVYPSDLEKFGAEITFRDGSGKYWRRGPWGGLYESEEPYR